MYSAAQDQQQGERLRILHWNIHSWCDASNASNLDAITDLVGETGPHVVSLVEVDEPWGMPDSLNELAHRMGYAWIFAPSFEFGCQTPGCQTPAGGFGNALLTRLPS